MWFSLCAPCLLSIGAFDDDGFDWMVCGGFDRIMLKAVCPSTFVTDRPSVVGQCEPVTRLSNSCSLKNHHDDYSGN